AARELAHRLVRTRAADRELPDPRPRALGEHGWSGPSRDAREHGEQQVLGEREPQREALALAVLAEVAGAARPALGRRARALEREQRQRAAPHRIEAEERAQELAPARAHESREAEHLAPPELERRLAR